MESCGLLDPVDETHLFALHYVFLPRINKALSEFKMQYIHHPMRTVGYLSPFQVFHEGVLHFSSHTGSRSILNDEVPEMFGVDEDGPWPELRTEEEESVVIDPIRNPLQPQDYDELCQSIDSGSDDQNYGITTFSSVLQFISDHC